MCQRFFFNKVGGLNPATLLKKRLRHRCLPVNFLPVNASGIYLWKYWSWRYNTKLIHRNISNIYLILVLYLHELMINEDWWPWFVSYIFYCRHESNCLLCYWRFHISFLLFTNEKDIKILHFMQNKILLSQILLTGIYFSRPSVSQLSAPRSPLK